MEIGREIASAIGLGQSEELGWRTVGEGRHGGHGGWQGSQEREGFVTHVGCGLFRVRFIFVSCKWKRETEVKKKSEMHDYGLYVDRIKRDGKQEKLRQREASMQRWCLLACTVPERVFEE